VESGGFEAHGSDECIEIVEDALVEAVELGPPLGLEPSIRLEGAEKACREWGIDALEELQEDEADGVSVREELIAARVGEFSNKAFGAEFREVVAERGERVAFWGAAERFDDGGVDFGSGEGIAGRDVCEAHERVHEGELPRVIKLEARNAFSSRGDRWFRELSQLAAIDKGFKDILLDAEVVIVDRR
jgi:hypothetical protein